MTDTIFALSSGAPPAAIAVIRISGPQAFDAIRALTAGLPTPRRASLRTLRWNGETIDRALVLTFPGPATATGEDLAELHLHGGRAVVRAVEMALGTLAGLRPAEAGEFTRRALINGRIGLTEAEGLADLLAAETESQRRAAIRATEGAIRQQVDGWATRTLQLSAAIEAVLDHSDEDDVSGERETLALISQRSAELVREIEEAITRPSVERLRDGIRVVLAGPPNAGKSTLLNAMVGRDAAIVSPIAGTTRDRIEAPVMRAGVAYLLIDTAGVHDAPSDMVEQIGIERTHRAIADADIVLWLADEPPVTPVDSAHMIALHARADEPGREHGVAGRISISAQTGVGVDALWDALARHAAIVLPPSDAVALNQRQRDLLAQAASALNQLAREADPLLVAERLRSAIRSFNAITGTANVETMLDELFGRFCIGK